MPRTEQKDQITIRLPEKLMAALDHLVRIGIHGSNRSDVARYLITRGVDDLRDYLREK